MNVSLRDSVRAGLGVPLLLVGTLAGVLGFFAGRAAYTDDAPARLSVLTTRGTLPATPVAPEEPAVEADEDGSSSTGEGRRSCPSGCECRFPRGGVIIQCGGSGTVELSPDEEPATPQPVPQGPPPSPPDLPGFG